MNASRDLRLVRIHAGGYGRLGNFTLEPAARPGAIVIAPNEAGKSTLASAILRGLFGFEDKSREDARRPWEGGPYAVTLEWALGDDRSCTITRDFDTQQVVVEWRRDGGALERRWEGAPNPRGRSSDREGYDAELRSLLGFSSPDLFRQTAFVGSEGAVRPLAAELLRLLSGSERTDFRAGLEELEEGYYAITRAGIRDPARPAKQYPRRLEENAERREELTRRAEAARTVHAERRRAEDALAAAQQRLGGIERELAERRPVGAAIRRLDEIRREEERAQGAYEALDQRLQRFADWESAVREREAELRPVARYLRGGAGYAEGLRAMERLGEKRDRLSSERQAVESERAGAPGRLAPALLVGAGVLWLALGSAAAALGEAARAAWILVAAAGLGLAAWGVWRERRRRVFRRELAARQGALGAEIDAVEAERRALAESLAFDSDGADPAAERLLHERARQLAAQLDGMREVRAALGDRAALEAERRVLKEERLDVLRLEHRRLIDGHPYFQRDPDYDRRFQLEGERLETERQALIDEELRHRRALAGLPPGGDDPRRLEVEVEGLAAEAERLAIERDAFRLAWTTLGACSGDFVRVMARRLEGLVSRIFADLTEGRYSEVQIDPRSLDLSVGSVEKVDVPATSLSRGTRDQLFLALRVAVLEVLSAERALPLVLDDPFLHFDRDRLSQAERTLARLGETHQILLLTHDTRLSDWSFPRVELGEPSGV